jgi:hypothetical protein
MTSTAHELPETTPTGDVWIYRIVVCLLGVTVLGALGGTIVLQASGAQVPDSIVAIGTGALGAIAGLLSPFSQPS